MLHLTNPCAKRKVLSLTKPKGKIYKTKSLCNYITKIYPEQTITDTDNAYNKALITNTPAQPGSLLHITERTAVGIGLHVNAYKTEYMCFNQRSNISTLKGWP